MPGPEERALRTICVFGGGLVGLTAAIAFARALPQVRIGLVDVAPEPAALADRMPGTLPSTSRFHAALGIDERDLVRSGAATHRLATRFERWSADGEPWYHVDGDYGFAAGSVPFHQLWLRARREKGALPFHRYAAGAVLAEAGKFVHPEQDPRSPLSTYDYALRLDPLRYREGLAGLARQLPLLRAEGALGGIERREDGGIAALLLADGRRLEADLFLDCSGPSAPLLSALDDRFEDWSESLPTDRLLLGSGPAPAQPSPVEVAAATSVGWRWASPLPDRTLAGLAYASGVTGEGRARRVLASEAGIDEAEAVAIRPGRRPEPWVRNVVAIGDAAVALDPLQSTNLALAQNAVARALALLPGRDCHPLELREYNRRTAQETGRVRDFLALQFLRSGRRKGELWEAAAKRPLPPGLAHTLQQFEARGRLPFYEEESFDKHGWLAVLLGMGVLPRAPDPVALAADPGESAAALRRHAEGLAGLPARLPSYRDYLAHMGAPRPA